MEHGLNGLNGFGTDFFWGDGWAAKAESDGNGFLNGTLIERIEIGIK